MSLLSVERAAQQRAFAPGPWSAMFPMQTHTICCWQKPGGLEYTTRLTRETKWVEGREQEDQTADRWDSGFPVEGCWKAEVGEGSCVVHPVSGLWKQW